MAEKQDEKTQFRDSLRDVVAVVNGLKRICETTEDLLAVCELACENDAQLHLLMKEIAGQKK